MNACEISGMLIFLAGRAQESFGELIGNRKLELEGHRRKIIGKSRMAIGDAQKVIANCVRRSCDAMRGQLPVSK